MELGKREIHDHERFINYGQEHRYSNDWFLKKASYLGEDYELLTDYRGCRYSVTFYHKKCGKLWTVRASGVVLDHYHCVHCFRSGGERRLIKFCKDNNIEILSEYAGMKAKVKFKPRSCNHEFYRSPSDLIWGTKECPYCNGLKPKGNVNSFILEFIKWRKRHGWTQADIAYQLKMSNHTISDLERGYKAPNKEQISLSKYYMDFYK